MTIKAIPVGRSRHLAGIFVRRSVLNGPLLDRPFNRSEQLWGIRRAQGLLWEEEAGSSDASVFGHSQSNCKHAMHVQVAV